MLEGTRGLLTNTVYAFSNATAKMSGTARKVRPARQSAWCTGAKYLPCFHACKHGIMLRDAAAELSEATCKMLLARMQSP